jgi:hypothetical protein
LLSYGGTGASLLTSFGNNALFTASPIGSSFAYLYITDGTVAGTRILSGENAASPTIGSVNLIPTAIVDITPTFALMAATSATNPSGAGSEIWRTNGTARGTRLVATLNSSIIGLAALGGSGKAVVATQTALYVTDGYSVTSIATVNTPLNLTTFGNSVWFTTLSASGNYTMWVTDGTAGGTAPVAASGLLGVDASGTLSGFGPYAAPIGTAPTTTTLASNGTTTLLQVSSTYQLAAAATGTGPTVKYNGAAITPGSLGTWTPVGAVQTATGYDVAFQTPAQDVYTVWTTDSSGNYTGTIAGGVSGGSLTLQNLETTFKEDLNGDGTIGLALTPGVSNGTTQFFYSGDAITVGQAGATSGQSVKNQGTIVTAGIYGGWTPIGARATATGYQLAWKLAGQDQYTIWNLDANGNLTTLATGVVSGTSIAIQGVETAFNLDLNGDGTTGTVKTTIRNNNVTNLVQVANAYELDTPGGASGPVVYYQAAPVTVGQLGGWAPIAATTSATGYLLAWKLANQDQYTVWNLDTNGNYTSSASGGLAGASFALHRWEQVLNTDLNGDFTTGPTTSTQVSYNGTTTLVRVDTNYYEMNPASGLGVVLQYQGAPAAAGQFGGWAPIGAVKTATGYQVAWKIPGQDQYTAWNTDANGNFTSAAITGAVSGSTLTLQQLESTFNLDLNGDFTTGPKRTGIVNDGTTTLMQYANAYQLSANATNTGPLLQNGGATVLAGAYGGWTLIGAVKTATGYQVAWKVTGQDQYTIWNTDTNANFTTSALGVVSGGSLALEQAETTFKVDLNGDGLLGPKTTQIVSNGTTKLVQFADTYQLNPVAGGTGPTVQFQGAAATATTLAGWTAIGAVKTGTTYQVAWKLTGQDLYTIWNVDANGNFTSSATGGLSGTSLTMEQFETTFSEDLNADGRIGVVTTTIASNGTTALQQVANTYVMTPLAGGTGPTLQFQGAAAIPGQFGGWAPIGAVKTATGYQVAWKVSGQDQYTVWNTDANGNYTSGAIGAVSGGSLAMEQFETTFNLDLNGDRTIGPVSTVIASNGVTSLQQVANVYEFVPVAGGSPVILQYQGSAVTVGQIATWSPIGAVKTATGFQVAWKVSGQNVYTVWNTDANGAYTTSATGAVTGQDFALEDLEPTFKEDLNGDGRLSSTLFTAPTSGSALNLTGNAASVTVNLGANTASASSGLNAPSLTFIGSPFAITLGSGAAIIEHALGASSGIETVANFALGTDVLNIDLLGAASSTLQAFDTTVGGVHAVAFTSSTDRAHGVVLTGQAAANTASFLTSSHLAFIGGHALIS